MFDWGALKFGVLESVRFCIGDIPMYTFLVPTHPYSQLDDLVIKATVKKYLNVMQSEFF